MSDAGDRVDGNVSQWGHSEPSSGRAIARGGGGVF